MATDRRALLERVLLMRREAMRDESRTTPISVEDLEEFAVVLTEFEAVRVELAKPPFRISIGG